MSTNRAFGLNIKKKEEPKKAPLQMKSVFGDDDDEDEGPVTATNMSSASVIRMQKAAEREHQKAEAEDPSVFDYDANYEADQAIKNEKKEEARKADINRESKYAASIIKTHARRQLEQLSREERQQVKDREKEGEEFADKEVFVTSSYKKQQEEVAKYRAEEAEEAKFNDLTSVGKQKMWEMGIGRTLLNDIARDPTAIKQRKEKMKNMRQRRDSDEKEEEEEKEEKKDEKKKEVKKSIYSDDEAEESAPPQKNFQGELKAGLNLVTKKEKATTHAERIRQRNFTPTPPSSDDEGAAQIPRRRRTSESPRRRSRDDRRSREKSPEDVKPDIRKVSLKEKLKPKKVDKVARLNGLKEILKQRNTPEDIEAIRQRYLERKEQGVVVPPL